MIVDKGRSKLVETRCFIQPFSKRKAASLRSSKPAPRSKTDKDNQLQYVAKVETTHRGIDTLLICRGRHERLAMPYFEAFEH